MEIEIRTEKYNKQPYPADQLYESLYDNRFVVPKWKWEVLRFIFKVLNISAIKYI